MSSETSRYRSESASGPPSRNKLRPYQEEIVTAVFDSANTRKGLTFSVEIARQGGKNELSAWLELLLMTFYLEQYTNLVKCSPTFKPQALISMTRLIQKLEESGYSGYWTVEQGHIVRVGPARTIFLSADKSASVVGNTAHLLLEVDEAQDVDKDKFTRDFKPMCSTMNGTTVVNP